jgi:hypothetical protein
MTGDTELSPAVRYAVELMSDGRNDVADAAAAIVASMADPDMVATLWPVARFGQRERHAFGVLLLHFVAGGFTPAEQRVLDFEVAAHRQRRLPSTQFPLLNGQVR